MAKSKDLFDDSTMSFGEHLEELRKHLWKALVGLALCIIVTLFFGNEITRVVRSPIDRALQEFNGLKVEDNVAGFDFFGTVKAWWRGEKAPVPVAEVDPEPPVDEQTALRRIKVQIPARQLAMELHRAYPQVYAEPPEHAPAANATSPTAPQNGAAPPAGAARINSVATPAVPSTTAATASTEAQQPPAPPAEPVITVWMMAEEFSAFRNAVEQMSRPVTLNVQEAFMTYIKVAVVAGLMLASPWVFFQIWQFVAAGLYPHERKYVYSYLPLSLFLFVGGAAFCFLFALPMVLKFLLAFNLKIQVTPQIRLSEWISFAIMLPLMFGISFQLPMVMLFLERISIFEAGDYREKRKMAILVIAILSCILTPPDPASMMLMMLPLVLLYELGIVLCGFSPARSPFEAKAA